METAILRAPRMVNRRSTSSTQKLSCPLYMAWVKLAVAMAGAGSSSLQSYGAHTGHCFLWTVHAPWELARANQMGGTKQEETTSLPPQAV